MNSALNNASTASRNRRFWWLRLLLAPIIYITYFMLAYLAVEAACTLGWFAFAGGGTNGITVFVIALTILTLLVVLFSLLQGVRSLRREAPPLDPQVGDADRFVTHIGVMLDLLFVFLILATGAPALLLAPCGWSS
jgi:hypothetical protein